MPGLIKYELPIPSGFFIILIRPRSSTEIQRVKLISLFSPQSHLVQSSPARFGCIGLFEPAAELTDGLIVSFLRAFEFSKLRLP